MTLVLALASEHEVHMTCDFKLTDARTHTQMRDLLTFPWVRFMGLGRVVAGRGRRG